MEEQFYDLSSFAVDDPGMEGMSLIDTIRKVKPNILIGAISLIISIIILLMTQDCLLVEVFLMKKF